jgi:hypothetical protein
MTNPTDNPEFESVTTDDQTINNSVTYPDGTTITTSPGSGGFGPTSDFSISFDTWTEVDASNPAFVFITCAASTDGNGDADIFLRVDESGGTTADYTYEVVAADAGLGAGGTNRATISVLVPAGGQILVDNLNNPNSSNAGNAIKESRKRVIA